MGDDRNHGGVGMLRQAQQCFPQLSRRVQLEKFLLEDCQVGVIQAELEF